MDKDGSIYQNSQILGPSSIESRSNMEIKNGGPGNIPENFSYHINQGSSIPSLNTALINNVGNLRPQMAPGQPVNKRSEKPPLKVNKEKYSNRVKRSYFEEETTTNAENTKTKANEDSKEEDAQQQYVFNSNQNYANKMEQDQGTEIESVYNYFTPETTTIIPISSEFDPVNIQDYPVETTETTLLYNKENLSVDNAENITQNILEETNNIENNSDYYYYTTNSSQETFYNTTATSYQNSQINNQIYEATNNEENPEILETSTVIDISLLNTAESTEDPEIKAQSNNQDENSLDDQAKEPNSIDLGFIMNKDSEKTIYETFYELLNDEPHHTNKNEYL